MTLGLLFPLLLDLGGSPLLGSGALLYVFVKFLFRNMPERVIASEP